LDKNENIYVTQWWDFIGVEKFTKAGEPATDFQIEDQSVFGLPADVVIDPDGIVYVSEHRNLDIDYGKNAGVHKIDTDGSYLEFIPITDSAIKDASKFSLMMMDHDGYLYIVDQGGNNIIILDATKSEGRALALINFQTPTSIAINPDGYFFVADKRYENNKRTIHIFDEYHLPFRTIGDQGKEDGKIWGAHGLEFDKDGNMYLLDFVQHKIQVFDLAPKVFEPIILDFYGETGKATPTVPSYSQSGDDFVAVLNTGSGKIVIEFFDEDAPGHVQNFIDLAENDWYETTLFHRIIKDFMIQGGDPNTKPEPGNTSDMWGIGGPGYSVDAEFNGIKHDRGIVSMARSNDPNSAGSQFFIVHKDSPHLDEKYTVFGRIITAESYETMDKIANLEVNSRSQPFDATLAAAILFDVDIVKRSTIENMLTMDPPQE
jgi:cyclophilin family peptidyl-prolyl cis-trans isomerase